MAYSAVLFLWMFLWLLWLLVITVIHVSGCDVYISLCYIVLVFILCVVCVCLVLLTVCLFICCVHCILIFPVLLSCALCNYCVLFSVFPHIHLGKHMCQYLPCELPLKPFTVSSRTCDVYYFVKTHGANHSPCSILPFQVEPLDDITSQLRIRAWRWWWGPMSTWCK